MNTTEVLQLCRMVKAVCPSQQFDAYTPEAWALLLGDESFEDARTVVVEIGRRPLDPGKSNYIEPGHIIGGIRHIRAKRLEATPVPAPPSEVESVAAQIEWQRAVREQIANGTYIPGGPVELLPGPAILWRDLLPSASTKETLAAKTAEVRAAIDDEAAERERARQLAAVERRIKETEAARAAGNEQEQQ